MLRQPHLKQFSTGECGIACLAAVLEHFGGGESMRQLRHLGYQSARGFSLLQLKEIAQSFDLNPEAHYLDLNELNTIKLPAILHWKLNHFVVLLALGDRPTLFDPAVGTYTLSPSEFSAGFTGYCLEFRPSRQASVLKTPPKSDGRFQLASLGEMAVGLFFGILIVSTSILIGIFPGVYYQLLSSSFTGGMLVLLIAGLVSVVWLRHALRGALGAIVARLAAERIQSQIASIQLQLRGIRLPVLDSVRPVDVVQLAAKVVHDLEAEPQDSADLFVYGLTVLAALVALLLVNLSLGVVGTAFILALGGLQYFQNERYMRLMRGAIPAQSLSDTILGENLASARQIGRAGFHDRRSRLWIASLTMARHKRKQATFARQAHGHLEEALQSLAMTAFLAVNIFATIAGQYSWAVMLTLSALYYVASDSLVRAVYVYRMREEATNALRTLESLFPLEHAEERVLVADGAAPSHPATGWLCRLDDVAYRPHKFGRDILTGISLELKAKQHFAVTGPPRSGKSTALNLIAGFIAPTSGNIHWQHGMGPDNTMILAEQAPFFGGTIAENVTGFDQEPDLAKLEACLGLAGFLAKARSLPFGIDTVISSELGLVPADLQRLQLARAFYLQPRILLWDNCASRIDPDSEARILQHAMEAFDLVVYVGGRPEALRQFSVVWQISGNGLGRVTPGPKTGGATVELPQPATASI